MHKKLLHLICCSLFIFIPRIEGGRHIILRSMNIDVPSRRELFPKDRAELGLDHTRVVKYEELSFNKRSELKKKLISALESHKLILLERAIAEGFVPSHELDEFIERINLLQVRNINYDKIFFSRGLKAIASLALPTCVDFGVSTDILNHAKNLVSCMEIYHGLQPDTFDFPESLLTLTRYALWIFVFSKFVYENRRDREAIYNGLEYLKYCLRKTKVGYEDWAWTHSSAGFRVNKEHLEKNLDTLHQLIKDANLNEFKRVLDTLPRREVVALLLPAPDGKGPLESLLWQSFAERDSIVYKKSLWPALLPRAAFITLCVLTLYSSYCLRTLVLEFSVKRFFHGNLCLNQWGLPGLDNNCYYCFTFLLFLCAGAILYKSIESIARIIERSMPSMPYKGYHLNAQFIDIYNQKLKEFGEPLS